MEHDVNSDRCWCGPEVLQPCPECHEGTEYAQNPDCWQCQGRGLIPEYDPDSPSVVIHNDTDDILRSLAL